MLTQRPPQPVESAAGASVPHFATPNPVPYWQTAAFGTLCGLIAAIGYTACNACLRAAHGIDPFLVAAVRTIPTVLLLAPLVLARPRQGLPMLPPWRIVLLLVVVGLFAYVVGNTAFQFGLGVVGIAIAVPLCLGSMIVAGALLGRIVLNEPVTPRMALGLSLLVASICALSFGAETARNAVQAASAHPTSQLSFGVAAACVSGLAYAIMGATLRYATRAHSNISQSLTIVSVVGLIALAMISSYTVNAAEFVALTPWQWTAMLLAGVFNAVSFVALTRALQLTSLVYVHALNATQAAMAAVAGILIFGEATSSYLFAGLALTIVGLAFMHGARKL